MRSRSMLLAVAATAIVASAIAALSAQGQSGTTLTFKMPAPGPRDVREVDLRPHGTSLGDETVGAVSLRAQGRLAGRAELVCTVTDRRFEGRQCLLTVILRDGIVTAQDAGLDRNLPGAAPSGTSDVFAVTGGTGIYDGASGTATIRHPRTGDVLTLEIAP
jgi:uncharacterized iron-regulated membrane protein